MDVTVVHVEFKKTISDGNFGNETYTVSYTADATEAAQDAVEVTDTLCDLARERVMAHLKRSPTDGIRQALETEEERQARWDAENEAWKHRRPE